jgi:transposase
MKNKMLKRSHLSEKKCREIIQLFSEDLTATQIASITGVSRVTINNYLKLIRTHIAKYAEDQSPRHHSNGGIRSLVSLNGAHGKELHSKDSPPVEVFYGFYRCENNVFVDALKNMDKATVLELQRARAAPVAGVTGMGAKINEDLLRYHAIADFDSWKLYRIDPGNIVNGKNHVDEISVFWSSAKSRLLKFRGLNKNTLYLHVKECEFRYNYRNADINSLLLNIIYKVPLHFSKSYQ